LRPNPKPVFRRMHDLSRDLAVSAVLHIVFLTLIPFIKFKPPMRFVEVSLVAQTSVLPQDLKNIQARKKKASGTIKTWTPGEGEPLPEVKISPERVFSLSAPQLRDENKPQISEDEMAPRIQVPDPKKFTPSFGKSDGRSFQISGPISRRHVIRRLYPEYPMEAKQRGISGEVTIKFWVLPDGIIEKMIVEKTSGSEILDKAAQDAIKKWLFAPLGREGERINQWGLLKVKFELR